MDIQMLTREKFEAIRGDLKEGKKTWRQIMKDRHANTRDLSKVKKAMEKEQMEGETSSEYHESRGAAMSEEEVVGSSRLDAPNSILPEREIVKRVMKSQRLLGTFDTVNALDWLDEILKQILPMTIKYETTNVAEIFDKLRSDAKSEGMSACAQENHAGIQENAASRVRLEESSQIRRRVRQHEFHNAVAFLGRSSGVPIEMQLSSLIQTPEGWNFLRSPQGTILMSIAGFLSLDSATQMNDEEMSATRICPACRSQIIPRECALVES